LLEKPGREHQQINSPRVVPLVRPKSQTGITVWENNKEEVSKEQGINDGRPSKSICVVEKGKRAGT